jgi:hypothetical protein
MESYNFKEVNLLIAKDQPEYKQLPVFANISDQSVSFCMVLTEDEILDLFNDRKIWIKVTTFGEALQPIAFSLNKSDFIPGE